MKRFPILLLTVTVFAIVSCGNKTEREVKFNDSLSTAERAEGDSTLYGLACEGCTDSVLVFLSFDGGDPVTYDIINATKHKRIIGHPETGDWVGVILNPTDKKKADMVIDLDQLKGTWVYQAMPKKREKKSATDIIMTAEEKAEQDSLLKSTMIPREQGFSLKRSSVAEPVGMVLKRNDDEDSPVIYPEMKMYNEWHVYNGKLLLTAGMMKPQGNKKKSIKENETDTIEFVFMIKDSLQLRFKDGVRSYYRKQ